MLLWSYHRHCILCAADLAKAAGGGRRRRRHGHPGQLYRSGVEHGLSWGCWVVRALRGILIRRVDGVQRVC
jgi:hypothetical protein